MTRRRPSPVFAAATALLLAGCFPRTDYSGIPDMSSITVARWQDKIALALPPAPDDDRRFVLAAFLNAIPGGPEAATVRYRVVLPPRHDPALYVSWAAALGADPARTTVVAAAPGTEPELEVTATAITPPDCDAMQLTPSQMRNERRATFAFGCATRGNLAAMVDDPADLVEPTAFGGASAPREAAAVRRYLDDKTKPLMKTTSTKSQ
jgi:type IV pilus biogenesis protein CpaD/CtpE